MIRILSYNLDFVCTNIREQGLDLYLLFNQIHFNPMRNILGGRINNLFHLERHLIIVFINPHRVKVNILNSVYFHQYVGFPLARINNFGNLIKGKDFEITWCQNWILCSFDPQNLSDVYVSNLVFWSIDNDCLFRFNVLEVIG